MRAIEVVDGKIKADIVGFAREEIEEEDTSQLIKLETVERDTPFEEQIYCCGAFPIQQSSTDKTWGCRRDYTGLSAFAQLLKSPIGRICHATLFPVTPQDLDRHQNAQRMIRHGIPLRLLEFYPDLNFVDWDAIPSTEAGLEDHLVREIRELSTIASISDRDISDVASCFGSISGFNSLPGDLMLPEMSEDEPIQSFYPPTALDLLDLISGEVIPRPIAKLEFG